MSVEFHATCDCGYKSRSLMSNTCVCRTCREVVDIPRLPFRYQLSQCPICGSDVPESQILLNMLGDGYLVADRPSALLCPKCNASHLHFHLDGTVSLIHGLDFPGVGDEVEGCVMPNGQLDIPWFPLDAADVTYKIPQELTVGKRVRMRVTEIEINEPTDTVMWMFYRFVVTRICLTFISTLSDSK